MTPEYRLSLLYNPSDPFWNLALISILCGIIFSMVFFGGLELLGWIRDSLRTGEGRLIKWRGPRQLGGGHR